jgi:hypothetical protein
VGRHRDDILFFPSNLIHFDISMSVYFFFFTAEMGCGGWSFFRLWLLLVIPTFFMGVSLSGDSGVVVWF